MDEIKAAFASNLIRLRTAAGLTQSELGEILHYSDKAVSKWERAESVPDALASSVRLLRKLEPDFAAACAALSASSAALQGLSP